MRWIIQTAAVGLLVACALLPGEQGSVCAQELDLGAPPPIEQAQTMLQRGEWARAIPMLEQALLRDPRHKGARSALISTLMRLNRFAEAEKHAALFAEQYPAETEPIFLRALIAFQQGQLDRVSDLSGQCLKRGDERAEVHKLYAISEYLLGRPENFEKHIRAAIKQNPRDADGQYHLGRYLFEQKRYTDALTCFETAIKLHPDHFKSHYYTGLLYEAENKLESARAAFTTAIKIIDRIGVRYAWPFADLGRQLVNEGDLERGLGWLYRAVRNDPSSPYAHYGYAKALFQQGASSEVKHELLEAIRLDPGYSEAYYLLARYYKKIGEEKLAQETFAKFDETKKNPVPSPFGLRRW